MGAGSKKKNKLKSPMRWSPPSSVMTGHGPQLKDASDIEEMWSQILAKRQRRDTSPFISKGNKN